ncbi:MAG: DHA2 family efflux MFS transporter permease subunit [Candidatus Saccharimonadales bacterium]
MIEKIKHKGLALAILAAAQFMVVLDATIVNVALPAVEKALGFTGQAQLQWIITAYALAFGGFLLLGGRLADLFGRRRIFMIGVTVFAVASLLAGLAQSPEMIIAFRALQGLGGALLSPAALSLVLTIFKEGPERNRALGVWSMVAAGGGAVGLLLGGVLTQYVDWRWIFFINVPVAAFVIFMAMRYVPKSLPTTRERVDVTGAVTITASLASIVFALAKVPSDGWGSSIVLGTFALSAVLMVVFIINELRVKNPLITLSIFKKRNVTGGTIIQTLMPAALFGMFFFLSIYLQQIQGYSPTQTGAANLPFTLVLIAVAGTLSRHIGKLNVKILLVVAPLIVASGLLFFANVPLHADYVTNILPGILLMGAGMAVTFVTVTVVATNGISAQQSGTVSGLLNTAQQIGGAIGLAVLSVISTNVTKDSLIAAQGNPIALPQALVDGFQRGFLTAAIFALIASIVALLVLKATKQNKTDMDSEVLHESEAFAALPGA